MPARLTFRVTFDTEREQWFASILNHAQQWWRVPRGDGFQWVTPMGSDLDADLSRAADRMVVLAPSICREPCRACSNG